MRNHTIILGILLFFSISIQAQTKNIKLKPEFIKIENRDFYISEVQDMRSQKHLIGFIQRGILNKRTITNLEGGVERGLLDFLNQSLPKSQHTYRAIIVRVYKFNIGEKTGMFSETGWADISLGFGIDKLGTYEEFFKTQSKEENTGIEVTAGHKKRIKKTIFNCLKDFALHAEPLEEENVAAAQAEDDSYLKNNDTMSGLDVDAPYLKEESKTISDKGIFNSEERKKGVYQSFEEFIQNSPSNENFKIQKINEQYVKLYGQKNKRIKDAFGFCDGRDVYINCSEYSMKKYYVKILEIGRYIVWLDDYVEMTEVAGLTPYDLDCICMPYDTGTILPLNETMINQILKDNPEFTQSLDFKVNANDALDQLKLLKKYNEKYPIE